MGLIAEYVLSFELLPLVGVVRSVPDTDFEITVGQPNQDERPVLVVRADGGSPETLDRSLADAPVAGAVSLIDRSGSERRYRVVASLEHWEEFKEATGDPEAFVAVTTNRSIVERIHVTSEGWLQTRRFADRDEFAAYRSFWRDAGGSISLRRLRESDVVLDPTGELTDAQLTALRTAHEMGYFSVPREASLAAVADELGISAPSASERLRRAQSSLLESSALDAY